LPTEHEALTAQQAAALGTFRARWRAIRRSTEPADRGAAEGGVRLAYRAAGLAPPERMIWCNSPIALAHLALRSTAADGRNVKAAIMHRLRRQAAASVARRVGRRVRTEVDNKVNSADALADSAVEAVVQAAAQDDEPLLRRLRRSRPLTWSRLLSALIGHEGLQIEAVGPHELSWLATYDYFRNVLALREETEGLLGLLQLAAAAGWWQPHERTCWLAERPELLHGDERDRLHDAEGPALRFRDGFAVWAWKGVEIPRWLIERPEHITLALIDAESNVQVRRCMIEIMTPERYVAKGGAVRVAEDETGVLWRKIWLASDAWAAVEVINATPEPDGTRRHFFLQVPPHMRTAREAVAWTYGLTPHAYRQLVVRT
jgi:hypothetical protein